MVSQLQHLQQRMGERARWFRLGMVSATAVAPLVTRWRSLRAAERARTLWEASQARGPRLRSHTGSVAPVPMEPPRANVRAGLWLAGAGVGLVAAGAVAFVIARRRIMLAAEERPLDLPLTGLNGREHRDDDTSARVRDTVAAPTGAGLANAEQTAPSSIATASSWDASAADGPDTEPVEIAPIIGNLRTLAYFAADAPDLPMEVDRVYFRSADDARDAGFHAAPAGD